jgi:hypothetical protein
MARTPRARLLKARLETNTTIEQAAAVDEAFPGQLIDKATKIRLLIDGGLRHFGFAPAVTGQHQQPAE